MPGGAVIGAKPGISEAKRKVGPSGVDPKAKRPKESLPLPPPGPPPESATRVKAPVHVRPSSPHKGREPTHHPEPQLARGATEEGGSPLDDFQAYGAKLQGAVAGKEAREAKGKAAEALTIEPYRLLYLTTCHVGGLVQQVEKLTKQNEVVSKAYDTLNKDVRRLREVEAALEKHAADARHTRELLTHVQKKLEREEEKTTSFSKEIDELNLARDLFEAEKRSLAEDHQRHSRELEGKIKEAEDDAVVADIATRSWRATLDMFENVLANLHKAVAPTLPVEVEEAY